jgi:hypothetical protein
MARAVKTIIFAFGVLTACIGVLLFGVFYNMIQEVENITYYNFN